MWPGPNLGEDRWPNRHVISRIQSGPQVLVKFFQYVACRSQHKQSNEIKKQRSFSSPNICNMPALASDAKISWGSNIEISMNRDSGFFTCGSDILRQKMSPNEKKDEQDILTYVGFSMIRNKVLEKVAWHHIPPSLLASPGIETAMKIPTM